MDTKTRFYYWEYTLTYLLFVPLFFLLPRELALFRGWWVIGFAASAVVSRISGDTHLRFRNIVNVIAHCGVLAWTLYLMMHSSFLYRDQIVICMKSLLVLTAVVSANSRVPKYLHSLQLYGLALFLCVCALTKEYYLPFLSLGAAFILLFFAISRAALKHDCGSRQEPRAAGPLLNAPFFILMVIALAAGWALSAVISPASLQVKGFFTEYDASWKEQDKEAQEAFMSDERFQDDLTKVVFRFPSTDQMHEGLSAVADLLAKDWAYAAALDESETRLLHMISAPEAGLEAGERKSLEEKIRHYGDREVSRKVKEAQEALDNAIKEGEGNLLKNIALLQAAHKIGASRSYEQVRQQKDEFEKLVQDSSFSNPRKEKLRDLAGQLKDWKAYQMFRNMPAPMKGEFARSQTRVSEEKDAEDAAEKKAQEDRDQGAEEARNGIAPQELSSEAPGALSPQEEHSESSQESDELRLAMLFSKVKGALRNALANADLSPEGRQDIEALLRALEYPPDIPRIQESAAQMRRDMETDDVRLPQEASQLLQEALQNLGERMAEDLAHAMQGKIFEGVREEASQRLENMEVQEHQEQIASEAMRLGRLIESLFQQGDISQEIRDSLVQQTESLKDIFMLSAKLRRPASPLPSEEKQELQDPQSQLSDFLDEGSAGEKTQAQLQGLMERLSASRTLQEVDELQDAISKEIEARAGKKETAEEMQALLQEASQAQRMFVLERMSAPLQEKIEALRRQSPRMAAMLEEKLGALRRSASDTEAFSRLKDFTRLLQSKEFRKQELSEDTIPLAGNSDSQGGMRIHVLPGYLVLSEGSSVTLKSIAVSDSMIKEIGADQRWVSSNPSIASVDQHGEVRAVSPGETRISVRYQGETSSNCEVTVVARIPLKDAVVVEEKARAQANR